MLELLGIVKNILVRLSGEDISFITMQGSLSFYLDEKTADSLSFHLGTILMDREHRKEIKK